MKLIGMMLEQRHGRYIKFFRRTDLPQCHFFPLDRDDVDGRRSALRIFVLLPRQQSPLVRFGLKRARSRLARLEKMAV
jgi:hypothetical protein